MDVPAILNPLSARSFESGSADGALERLYGEGLTWPGKSTIDVANLQERSWGEGAGWNFSTSLG